MKVRWTHPRPWVWELLVGTQLVAVVVLVGKADSEIPPDSWIHGHDVREYWIEDIDGKRLELRMEWPALEPRLMRKGFMGAVFDDGAPTEYPDLATAQARLRAHAGFHIIGIQRGELVLDDKGKVLHDSAAPKPDPEPEGTAA